MALQGDLDEYETDSLRDEVAKKAGAKTSTIKRMLKQGFAKQRQEQEAAERERRLAERSDPRPLIPVPAHDAPWIPVALTINLVARPDQRERRPANRDIEHYRSKAEVLIEPPDNAFSTANESEQSWPPCLYRAVG